VKTFEASIDGVAVQNLSHYRFQSPVTQYRLPNDNVFTVLFDFSVPAGTYAPAVSDGYWLLLKPLTPGVHDIVRENFSGTGTDTLHLIVGD
jgi:hypothetical protein